MSIRARPEASAASAAGIVEQFHAASASEAAGRLLGRLSVLPALLATAWLLAGLPLLLAGHFTAVLALVVWVPIAVIIVGAGLRWIPGGSPGAGPALGSGARAARTHWWAVAGVVAVAVVFGVIQLIYHSQFIIPTRDPATYIQFANWIAHHGSVSIPQNLAAFGGSHDVLTFSSSGFYQSGTSVVPQFMAGLPMILAAGVWIGGISAAAAFPAVIGACAVLTFGGLAARLVGRRWAPLAALVLALALPEEFTSRSSYSEPLAQILLLGGLCLVIDSLSADGAGARILAGLGGLALGLTVLVRIDGAGDILPVVPYCGLLFLGRRRQAAPFLAGLVVGGGYGILDGVVLSSPYLHSIRTVLLPLVAVAIVGAVATALVVAVRWHQGVPDLAGTLLPRAAAALAVLVVIGFAVRPYVQVTRSRSEDVANFQAFNHLPIDPTREYYELSMHWVFWYIGVPAVILGTVGAALLSRRCLRGEAPAWVLPLAIFAWATVTTLYRPSIRPDQPWASRRLVPVVLPAFILLAVWAVGRLHAWLREANPPEAARAGGPSAWPRRARAHEVVRIGLPACCVAAMIVPAAITTYGLSVHDGRLVANGVGVKKTHQGEFAAVSRLCAAIPGDASVVFVNSTAEDEAWLAQVVRGTCSVPVASIASANSDNVAQVVGGIYQAGRRPVLLADTRQDVAPYGGQMRRILALRTHQDASSLITPPTRLSPFTLTVWMSQPPR